ncbi:MAG: c-type cytochrome [Halofilum sp. (in: g-proteobacteria)]|nr:c-type cytochrome [Halofilum sp. (in: g-proteobacteria)]
MKKVSRGLKTSAFAAVLLATATTAAAAEGGNGLTAGGDAESGQALSQTCVACHGSDGNSPQGMWPNLAGQHAAYLYQQLKDFKAGQERRNAQMLGMVSGLSDQDMRDLAAYYAQQPHKVMGAQDEARVQRGQEIYLGGIPSKGVAACIACHGPRGRGNPAADYPRVGGQWAQYLLGQLQAFRAGHGVGPGEQVEPNQRANDNNAMMRSLAHRMTDEEMRAVAEYMAGLH